MFWFLSMFCFGGSDGPMARIVIVFTLLPTMFIQWKRRSIQEKNKSAGRSLVKVNTITK